jgi:hypothetical protein
MNYKIAQLLLTPGARANTTAEIFIAQPDADKEILAGKLFALIEIESKRANDLKIINFLIENLNNNYYQNEKMILRERVKTVKVEHIFESALAKTNKNLAEFLRAEKIRLNPKLINATVGIIYESDLHFASIGKNRAFLIYRNKNDLNQKKYGLADIVKESRETERKMSPSPSKLFSNVISGSIPKYGYFTFTNEALPEYLSSKQLIDIITTLPPASAAEQIKNELSRINYYVSFLGLIMKNTLGYEKEKPILAATPATTKESISRLNMVEEKTEKLMAPRGLVNFKKWFGLPIALISKINIKLLGKNGIEPKVSKGLLRDKIFFKKKASLIIFKKIWLFAKNIIFSIINLIVYIFKLLTNKEKLFELAKKIKTAPAAIKTKIKTWYLWFKNLSRRNKILIALTVVFLLLFAQGIIVSGFKNKKIVKEEAYLNLIKPIEQKLNQAEAGLLYNNEDSAKTLLKEARELLNQLPHKTSEQVKQYETYNKKYNELLEKIIHAVKIENPRELADFTKLSPGANPDNIIISSAIGKINAGDSREKKIYSLSLSDKTITSIAKDDQLAGLKYPVSTKDDNIYYLNGSNIILLNVKTDEISSLTINLKNGPQNILGMASYNNKLYLIDKKDNQIYSYVKSGNGFPTAAAWFKVAADLSDAASLSIDGSIYILKKNGQLLKYLKGKEEEFNLDAVEPAIEEAKKVMVSPELNYIYILEPSKQRLVVFDKTGKFILQYKSDQFTDLKDFTVDEKKKIIYFLNGNSVFEVAGEHFK